jgi:hypothetical protein
MNRRRVFCLVFLAAVPSPWACVAQTTTVLLATPPKVGAGSFLMPDKEHQAYDLEFGLADDVGIFKNAKIEHCNLRIVAEKQRKPDDQDVHVFAGAREPISTWSAFGDDVEKNPKSYLVPIGRSFCLPKAGIKLSLQSNSSSEDWSYYSPAADPLSYRPRLIVTYTSSSGDANTSPSGPTTEWKYARCPVNKESTNICTPSASPFFTSSLGKIDGDPLTNLVVFDGQVFVVVGSPVRLYRLSRAGQTTWPLKIKTAARSVAFATGGGSLRVITDQAVYSCDLADLPSAGQPMECPNDKTPFTIDADETPAMGADGSVYFRGLSKEANSNGSLVAFNPSRQLIWKAVQVGPTETTEPKLTKISPITLSADGRYAYFLAKITKYPADEFALWRVDTWTGEAVKQPIEDDKHEHPLFKDGGLLRPAVLSREKEDYVFVAGNMANAGTVALFLSDKEGQTVAALERLWTLPDNHIVQAGPVFASSKNSLFVVQDHKVNKYAWPEGEIPNPAPEPKNAAIGIGNGDTLLVDADNTVYSPAAQYQSLQFTSDGAIIGYKDRTIYDISPKSAASFYLKELAPGTIYSAAKVTVLSQAVKKRCELNVAANKAPCNEAVILKGNSISLPTGFHWPIGATLRVVSMPLQ